MIMKLFIIPDLKQVNSSAKANSFKSFGFKFKYSSVLFSFALMSRIELSVF